jgi:hypothetical protein
LEIWRVLRILWILPVIIREYGGVFTAFIMEILRILNGFKGFNGNMVDFKRFYGYLLL